MSRFLLAFAPKNIIKTMQPTDPLYDYVRQMMLEIMAVLWANGQRTVHVGAIMRLLGVPESQASEHDQEFIELDESFRQIVADLNIKYQAASQVPDGATIH